MLPVLERDVLDLFHRFQRLLLAAVGEEPARALGQVAPHVDDDDREQRADQERQPPAEVRRERVEQDEGRERADD